MKWLAASLFSFCLFVGGIAAASERTIAEGADSMPNSEDIRAVAPALEGYAQKRVMGDLWKRPGLSPRDRSIVTVAALIARDQTVELPHYLAVALDNGVKPAEISEIITHLAFYAGWANAMDAIPAAKEAFRSRNIGADQLPPASGPQLPLDEAAEKQRAARVGEQFGEITPSLVQYTTEVLFRDLWLRPALVPRDRSLVTVSALIATGQVAQITYHLNRAMDNGLTRQEAGEVLGHLAFYAGWPNAFSAAPVVKDVIEKRGAKLSPPANERYVRVAQIEVDPSQLAPYKAAVKEQIEAAVRLEPGVLALYCVADKENPARVFVFEMYADIHAYKAHVETAHFRKYKLTTQDMVKSLTLIDTVPVLLGAKP